MDSSGPEAVKLAASAGLVLDPWQADFLDVALGEREDGKWAAREVALICPRQNGKGSILEAMIAASLLLFDERLILYSAHEFKTAQETFLRVKGLFESHDDLDRMVSKVHSAHGQEGIELKDGGRLRFVARSKGSGRGFSPQRVILDEALILSDRAVAAVLFSMSAQANPQLWFVSSAPEDEAPEGEFLRGVMRRGREGSPTLAYTEFCAPDDADLDDPQAWATANPGYPIRISHETIEGERLIAKPADFARERLGIVDLSTETFKVIDAGQWEACRDPRSKHGPKVAYALDVSPEARSCAVAASDGAHVEVVAHAEGTAWVVAKCVAKRDAFSEIVLDPTGPAGQLVKPLEAAGIKVRQVTSREAMAACGGFLTAVTDCALRHLGQPELDAAVANADRRDVGDGGWMWSRLRSSVDITPLYAATLARWAATDTPAPTPSYVSLDDFLDEE